ncbi:2-amino-4-hydroxy-6-hydroxymethyldihydropteridine diphosphokinase [Celerinatantimonas sp. YJH-8]|uniref:2-amino-4-hydroxy-6- hydroxymethyldihydropteridine diphosphokinase n=1 Tax=Celerinatantimonas sp. YJH-8 TaxID=3228714 RepID=UPI0038C90087
MFYLCSLGSNISPEQHVPAIIAQLSAYFSPITFSSLIYTAPSQMISSHDFVNGLFYFKAERSIEMIKRLFNQLEMYHGRNKRDPQSSQKDRVLDLDILMSHSALSQLSHYAPIPEYLKPLHDELFKQHPLDVHQSKFICQIGSLQLGNRATTIHSDPSPG